MRSYGWVATNLHAIPTPGRKAYSGVPG
jgi:hypothetical protein